MKIIKNPIEYLAQLIQSGYLNTNHLSQFYPSAAYTRIIGSIKNIIDTPADPLICLDQIISILKTSDLNFSTLDEKIFAKFFAEFQIYILYFDANQRKSIYLWVEKEIKEQITVELMDHTLGFPSCFNEAFPFLSRDTLKKLSSLFCSIWVQRMPLHRYTNYIAYDIDISNAIIKIQLLLSEPGDAYTINILAIALSQANAELSPVVYNGLLGLINKFTSNNLRTLFHKFSQIKKHMITYALYFKFLHAFLDILTIARKNYPNEFDNFSSEVFLETDFIFYLLNCPDNDAEIHQSNLLIPILIDQVCDSTREKIFNHLLANNNFETLAKMHVKLTPEERWQVTEAYLALLLKLENSIQFQDLSIRETLFTFVNDFNQESVELFLEKAYLNLEQSIRANKENAGQELMLLPFCLSESINLRVIKLLQFIHHIKQSTIKNIFIIISNNIEVIPKPIIEEIKHLLFENFKNNINNANHYILNLLIDNIDRAIMQPVFEWVTESACQSNTSEANNIFKVFIDYFTSEDSKCAIEKLINKFKELDGEKSLNALRLANCLFVDDINYILLTEAITTYLSECKNKKDSLPIATVFPLLAELVLAIDNPGLSSFFMHNIYNLVLIKSNLEQLENLYKIVFETLVTLQNNTLEEALYLSAIQLFREESRPDVLMQMWPFFLEIQTYVPDAPKVEFIEILLTKIFTIDEVQSYNTPAFLNHYSGAIETQSSEDSWHVSCLLINYMNFQVNKINAAPERVTPNDLCRLDFCYELFKFNLKPMDTLHRIELIAQLPNDKPLEKKMLFITNYQPLKPELDLTMENMASLSI